ncbi:hypothetical protein EYF80_025970 [Liparis tanakae]|uniref:Uncharacterized protein n=1 Tax=Liparis tanakae TaxID=230148 RepID=A0A4Z2HD26_9TELE|nr:hypothetical protein EYF80_025970 [Liparis tanakae]
MLVLCLSTSTYSPRDPQPNEKSEQAVSLCLQLSLPSLFSPGLPSILVPCSVPSEAQINSPMIELLKAQAKLQRLARQLLIKMEAVRQLGPGLTKGVVRQLCRLLLTGGQTEEWEMRR